MSGVKQTFVCVEEDELERLKYNESRLLELQGEMPQRLSNVRSQVEREMREKFSRIEKRQIEYQQFLFDLNGELKYFELETQRKLQEQNKRLDLMRNEYFSLMHHQRNEYLSIFQKQEEKFQNMIEDEKSERKIMINNLQQQINSILFDKRNKEERVKNFIFELEKIVRENEKLPYERFTPGKFDHIGRQVNDSVNDFNTGFFETALSSARSAYWKLVDLRTEVLQKENEFLNLYLLAREFIDSLIEKTVMNRKRTLEFGKGEKRKQFDVEIDYWAKGDLNSFEQEVKDLKTYLVANEKKISIEGINDLIKKINDMENVLNKIIERARENILSSQLRVNVAQMAVKALKEQLFAVEDSAFENNDPRNAYFVKLKNRAGSEIVTIISPVEGGFGKNEITIHSFDGKPGNIETLNNRALEITSSLSRQRLEVGKLKTISDEPENNFRDFEKIRSKKFSN